MLLSIYSMNRKNGLEIKKKIIDILKSKECSIRELETKVNTNNITIKNHLEELKFLKIIELIQHKKNSKNGRPYTTAILTKEGLKLLYP